MEIRTMKDLLEALPKLGYTEKTINQIRPRIKDCEKIYKTSLDRIPADLAKFEETWGRGRIGALANGFDSHAHFLEWRKRVRGALSRIQTSGPKPERSADWQRLCDVVTANSGPTGLLGPHRVQSIGKFADIMSADRVGPADLGQGAIDAAAAHLKGTNRRTFKAGIRVVNDLMDLAQTLPEAADLLPETRLEQPARVKSIPSPWRRGGCPEAADLWRDFDRFVASKRGTDALGREIPAEESTFKSRSARTYESALTNATGLLARSGDLKPGDHPRLWEICSLAGITRVAKIRQTRVLDGEVRKDASTLHLIIERLSNIAIHQDFLSKKDARKLKKLRDRVRKGAPNRSRMSAPRLEWIKAFARSPAQQRAVHSMPEQLMRRSTAILSDWDGLKVRKRHKERMRALSLGIAATQAAILFRGSAVRAGNLRGLTFRGPDAQIFVDPENKDDLRISIPGHLVKNYTEIDADCDADAGPIIDWYLREIRPRLITEHPYGHNLTDSDFMFPAKRHDRPLEDSVFADHYRNGAEAAGLDMTLHQARHITTYFILAEDPSAIGLAAAVLGDDPGTVKNHYAWLDGVKAQTEARELLRQSRQKARKHVKGRYADAA